MVDPCPNPRINYSEEHGGPTSGNKENNNAVTEDNCNLPVWRGKEKNYGIVVVFTGLKTITHVVCEFPHRWRRASGPIGPLWPALAVLWPFAQWCLGRPLVRYRHTAHRCTTWRKSIFFLYSFILYCIFINPWHFLWMLPGCNRFLIDHVISNLESRPVPWTSSV